MIYMSKKLVSNIAIFYVSYKFDVSIIFHLIPICCIRCLFVLACDSNIKIIIYLFRRSGLFSVQYFLGIFHDVEQRKFFALC